MPLLLFANMIMAMEKLELNTHSTHKSHKVIHESALSVQNVNPHAPALSVRNINPHAAHFYALL